MQISEYSQSLKPFDYQSPVPVQLMMSVMDSKSKIFLDNANRIQSRIDQLGQFDIARDIDKSYLSDKLNKLVEHVNGLGGQDLSDPAISNGIMGLSGTISGDPTILNAISSTQQFRNLQNGWKKIQEDPKEYFSPALYDWDMRQATQWLASTKPGEKYNGPSSPTRYVDWKGMVQKGIDSIKANSRPVITPNGTMYQIDEHTYVTEDDVRKKAESSLNDEARNVMNIEGWHNYKNLDDATLKTSYSRLIDSRIAGLKHSVEDIHTRMAAEQDPIAKETYNNQLSEYNKEIKNLSAQKDATYIAANKFAVYGDLYKTGQFDQLAAANAYDNIKTTFHNLPETMFDANGNVVKTAKIPGTNQTVTWYPVIPASEASKQENNEENLKKAITASSDNILKLSQDFVATMHKLYDDKIGPDKVLAQIHNAYDALAKGQKPDLSQLPPEAREYYDKYQQELVFQKAAQTKLDKTRADAYKQAGMTPEEISFYNAHKDIVDYYTNTWGADAGVLPPKYKDFSYNIPLAGTVIRRNDWKQYVAQTIRDKGEDYVNSNYDKLQTEWESQHIRNFDFNSFHSDMEKAAYLEDKVKRANALMKDAYDNASYRINNRLRSFTAKDEKALNLKDLAVGLLKSKNHYQLGEYDHIISPLGLSREDVEVTGASRRLINGVEQTVLEGTYKTPGSKTHEKTPFIIPMDPEQISTLGLAPDPYQKINDAVNLSGESGVLKTTSSDKIVVPYKIVKKNDDVNDPTVFVKVLTYNKDGQPTYNPVYVNGTLFTSATASAAYVQMNAISQAWEKEKKSIAQILQELSTKKQ